MRRFLRIIRIINRIHIVLYVCLCILLFFFIENTNLRFSIVSSGSMAPQINTGDIVMWEKTKCSNDLQVGDIAIYVRGERYIIHRVQNISVDKNGKRVFEFKGDVNKVSDPDPVSSDQIQGKYLSIAGDEYYLVGFLKSIYGKVITALILVLLITIEVVFLKGVTIMEYKNLCKYCKEDCVYKGTDSNNVTLNCFVLDLKTSAYLQTRPDDEEHYCKLFAVSRKWLDSHPELNLAEHDEFDSKMNTVIYEKAFAEDQLLFAETVYSSEQYNKTGKTTGEWLALDKEGHQIILLTKGFLSQEWVFKDPSAFESHSDRICYIAENDVYTEDYTYSDFLDIAKGSRDVAVFLFNNVDWQHPETVFDESIREGEIGECSCCGRWYLSYNKSVCDQCGDQTVSLVRVRDQWNIERHKLARIYTSTGSCDAANEFSMLTECVNAIGSENEITIKKYMDIRNRVAEKNRALQRIFDDTLQIVK